MTALQQHERSTTQPTVSTQSHQSLPSHAAGYALGALRLIVGLTFLWAFLDKLLALGFATGKNPETGAVDRFGADAWINGGSPTEGFLAFGAAGPFQSFYNSIAGDAWVNWAFMLGLLAIGVAFTLGIFTRLATIGGVIMYVMMWTVVLPPDNNPILDDHLLAAAAVLVLGLFSAGRYLGLGSWWERQPIVQRSPILK
jgi:thiosulfate dehydrogenase [quinone] large subunit